MQKVDRIVKAVQDFTEPIIANVDPALVVDNIRSLIGAGKKIQDFDSRDWMFVFGISEDEIAWENIEEGFKVAFKHDENNEFIAHALVSAMKDVRAMYTDFKDKNLDEVDFLYEAQWRCLDAVVSILASCLRGSSIDAKAFGIIIDEKSFNLAYSAVKDSIRGEWENALARYAEEQKALDEALESRYRDYINWLEKDMTTYMEILPRAFSANPEEALAGSADLARFLKLPRATILDSVESVDDFFLS